MHGVTLSTRRRSANRRTRWLFDGLRALVADSIGIEQAPGIEDPLDAPAGGSSDGGIGQRQVVATACRGRSRVRPRSVPRAPGPQAKSSRSSALALVVVGEEDRQVDVAVTDVTAAPDEGLVASADARCTSSRNSGTVERGTTMSMISFARRPWSPRTSRSRASMRRVAASLGQHVDVERAGFVEQRPQIDDVGLELVRGAGLEDHDEIGGRLARRLAARRRVRATPTS